MINSKKKGNNFELTIANYLTAKTGVKWHRVGVRSGGRATAEGIKDNRFRGDVFSEDDLYTTVTVECKARKDALKLSELFDGTQFHQWIEQSIDEAGENTWMLFLKTGYTGKIYMVIDPFDNTSLDLFKKNTSHVLTFNYKYGLQSLELLLGECIK